MADSHLGPYRVSAYNTAQQSENKIHDDGVASRFGFRGGLVPGAEVYAYMTHLPVLRWGRDWLEHGAAECRFLSPVYDGETAAVTATETPAGLAIELRSGDTLCATGEASLRDGPEPPPLLDGFRAVSPPPEDQRPPADEISLATGTWLSMRPLTVTPEFAAAYLAEVRETAGLYAAEGLVHPGLVGRLGNAALTHNVRLGPWIHVGSRVAYLSAARIGETLSLRAQVTGNYERKGHRFVELDALILAGERKVARLHHVAIYRPRQVAEST
jgi:acyl dehydratase